MSIQDVPVEQFGSSAEPARIMWDNGCEAALVTFAFAEKSCFPFIQKKYLVAGVLSEPQVMDGKLYTIDLIDRDGNNERITAHGVPSLLNDPVGHGHLGPLAEQFPKVYLGVFEALKPKPLDLLIGNEVLSLQPKCMNGRDYQACGTNLFCYESKFGHGHVLVGNVTGLSDSPKVASMVTQMVNSI